MDRVNPWSEAAKVIAGVLELDAYPGTPMDLTSRTERIYDALKQGGFLSDVPLGFLEHSADHESEFEPDCSYCDWERDHNAVFRYGRDQLPSGAKPWTPRRQR